MSVTAESVTPSVPQLPADTSGTVAPTDASEKGSRWVFYIFIDRIEGIAGALTGDLIGVSWSSKQVPTKGDGGSGQLKPQPVRGASTAVFREQIQFPRKVNLVARSTTQSEAAAGAAPTRQRRFSDTAVRAQRRLSETAVAPKMLKLRITNETTRKQIEKLDMNLNALDPGQPFRSSLKGKRCVVLFTVCITKPGGRPPDLEKENDRLLQGGDRTRLILVPSSPAPQPPEERVVGRTRMLSDMDPATVHADISHSTSDFDYPRSKGKERMDQTTLRTSSPVTATPATISPSNPAMETPPSVPSVVGRKSRPSVQFASGVDFHRFNPVSSTEDDAYDEQAAFRPRPRKDGRPRNAHRGGTSSESAYTSPSGDSHMSPSGTSYTTSGTPSTSWAITSIDPSTSATTTSHVTSASRSTGYTNSSTPYTSGSFTSTSNSRSGSYPYDSQSRTTSSISYATSEYTSTVESTEFTASSSASELSSEYTTGYFRGQARPELAAGPNGWLFEVQSRDSSTDTDTARLQGRKRNAPQHRPPPPRKVLPPPIDMGPETRLNYWPVEAVDADADSTDKGDPDGPWKWDTPAQVDPRHLKPELQKSYHRSTNPYPSESSSHTTTGTHYHHKKRREPRHTSDSVSTSTTSWRSSSPPTERPQVIPLRSYDHPRPHVESLTIRGELYVGNTLEYVARVRDSKVTVATWYKVHWKGLMDYNRHKKEIHDNSETLLLDHRHVGHYISVTILTMGDDGTRGIPKTFITPSIVRDFNSNMTNDMKVL
mmetsp:Transcript_46727/g.83673  ORF Transcript_46727/g.83673 Transcript_46727/m.83673 type:complete len:769 (-) Transcript_46727:230-2536(-)